MKYLNVRQGKFIRRLNRFIAEVSINGEINLAYVPNTGRCKEIFSNGANCYLSENFSDQRKTKFTLITLEKNQMLINIDSQAPNAAVEEAIKSGKIDFGFEVTNYIREFTYDKSRFDFYLEGENKKAFLEVKGVTLENYGIASFPDAPTLRGSKHLKELIKAKKEGYEAYILFLIQMHGPHEFYPNYKADKAFANYLKEADLAGVKILAYDSLVKEDEIILDHKIDYNLHEIILRPARMEDKNTILKIYDDGSKSLKAMGVDQWQGIQKPNLDNMKELVDSKELYVLDDKGIVATAILSNFEKNYNRIDGAWKYEGEYIVIHRFAVSGSFRNKGYARKLLYEIENYALNQGIHILRIDTHKDNYKMQNLLKSCNFEYAGITYIYGNVPRQSFEKPLK